MQHAFAINLIDCPSNPQSLTLTHPLQHQATPALLMISGSTRPLAKSTDSLLHHHTSPASNNIKPESHG